MLVIVLVLLKSFVFCVGLGNGVEGINGICVYLLENIIDYSLVEV